jgi:membrane protein YqaA with SNARE-associated domain
MSSVPPKPSSQYNITLSGKLLRLLLFLVITSLTVSIFIYRDQLQSLQQYGYFGTFVVNLVASGTVLLPAPGALFTYAFGAVLSPPLVALASATGASIGELSGYAAGVSGQAVIGNTKFYRTFHGHMQKHSNLTGYILLIAATIPNPFFDLVGIAAGALRFPLVRFLTLAFIGNLIKMYAIASAGYYSLQWLSP